MQKIWTIITKELKSHFDNFSGYILIFLFLLITYYFFFQTFFVSGEITVQTMFSDLSWLLCVFVAAITMNSFASERDKMTIEYLLTKPITITQLLTGKILGNFIYTLLPLVLTLPLPFFVSTLGQLDWGEVGAGYLAASLLSFSLVCLGTALSALAKKPIIAFISTAVVLLFLNIVSSQFFAINLSPGLSSFFARFGLMDHYFNLLRGMVDITDLAYFILLALIGYITSYLIIFSWRFNKLKLPLWQVSTLVCSIVILGYIAFGNHPWLQARFDLTTARRYTISPLTKEILAQDGQINVDVYISDSLPSQFQNTIQEIKNTLNDYSRLAGNKLSLQYISPKGKEQELAEKGIIATPFSVVSEDNFQQQTGYVAAIITNQDNDKEEVVNFLNINNIDYELTRVIARLKSETTNQVGVLVGAGEIPLSMISPTLTELLSSEIEFVDVDLEAVTPEQENETPSTSSEDEDEAEINLSDYSALVIAQPTSNYTADSSQKIYDYYEQGGKILYLTSGNNVDTQVLMVETMPTEFPATENEDEVSDPLQIFAKYGLNIDHNLIGDYQTPSIINAGGNSLALAQYEFWPRVFATENGTDLTQLPTEITMFWPSSLQYSNNAQNTWQPLYQTTQYGIATSSSQMIDATPKNQLPAQPQGELGQYTVAGVLSNQANGQIIAIANPQVFADSFLNSNSAQSNLVFGMSVLERLSDSRDFSSIQARQIAYPRLVQDQQFASKKTFVQVGAPLISCLLLGGMIGLRFYRKHRLRQIIETL